jgi:hypothetical protein
LELTAPDGTRLTGTYSYDPVSTVRGSLSLNFADGPSLDLDMSLTAGGTGKFKEIPATQGDPGGGGSAPRNGTFTLPEEQAPPPNPDCPPPGLSGRSFFVNDDSSPCTLTFNSDGTGVQEREVNGSIEKTYFNYSYSRTGNKSASVSVTFPGAGSDLVEDYDMDFEDDCTGKFHRDSYADGDRAGSSAGTFGPGGLAGRSPGAGEPGLGP